MKTTKLNSALRLLDIYMKFFGLIYPNSFKPNQHELYKNFAYRGWISPKLIEIVDTPFK